MGVPIIHALSGARAIAGIYSNALLATVPIAIAGLAGLLLRRASAEARGLVWRSAVVTLLVVWVGRQLPLHWMAWVMPSALAEPLVALGRVQVAGDALRSAGAVGDGATRLGIAIVRALLAVYAGGVAITLAVTVGAWLRLHRLARRAASLERDPSWSAGIAESGQAVGLTRLVRVCSSPEVAVPMTWGIIRPIVVVPARAERWNSMQRKIVLAHELAHVDAADWVFNLAARLVGALYWFHPGVWWLARQMREDCEQACDDRVIATGIPRSDYAELLVGVAAGIRAPQPGAMPALALSGRSGLRARLAAVLDPAHDVHPLARRWITVATAATLAVAGPMSAVQLAPTRDVLTTLMRDPRWESRAYAVLGLAQRADSVAVARSAAALDPSPRVRAWARYALGERDALTATSARAGVSLERVIIDNR